VSAMERPFLAPADPSGDPGAVAQAGVIPRWRGVLYRMPCFRRSPPATALAPGTSTMRVG
jgi:hypothetical protein